MFIEDLFTKRHLSIKRINLKKEYVYEEKELIRDGSPVRVVVGAVFVGAPHLCRAYVDAHRRKRNPELV